MHRYKNFLSLIVLIAPLILSAKTIKIDDFSSLYYAEVDTVKKELFIRDKKTKKTIIDADITDVDLDYEESNHFQSNVAQRPYGDQSLIIYDDFNFDGKKDFAIKNGNHSCYGGPSFLIYLKKGTKFFLDDDFTRVAQEYCGMFGIDKKTKTIHAMTKSGCCWHLFDEYKVEKGALKLVKSVEETYGFPFIEYITKEYKGGKEIVHKSVDINIDEVKVQFSFRLKNGKKVILFENDGLLYYTLIDKQNHVEFAFNREPMYDEDQEPGKSFIYITDASNRIELHFNTEDARYTIYQVDDKNKISQAGITVETKGKLYELKGLSETIIGNLKDIVAKNEDETLKNILKFQIDEKTNDQYLQGIYKDIKDMTPKDYMRILNVYGKTVQANKGDHDREKIDSLIQQYKDAILNKERDKLFSLYYRDHLLYKFFTIFGGSKSTEFFERELLSGYTYDIPKDECKAPRLLQYPKDETGYNGCWTSATVDDVVDVKINRVYKENSYHLNIILIKKDGSKIYVIEHIEKIKQSDGETVYVFGNYPG